MSKEHTREADSEKPVASERRVTRQVNGEVTVQVSKQAQTLAGIQVATLTATQLRPRLKAYGRVLDPAALSTDLADWVSARAAVEASRHELARLKTLAAQNNASAHTLESAQATEVRDLATAESARARFVAAWGTALADRKALPAFVESLAAGANALVRVDLLAGDVLKSPPEKTLLFSAADPANPVQAILVGAAPTIDPHVQGRGLFFLAATNRPDFSPGASVTAYLPDSGEPLPGVEITRDAVVRFNGRAWVFVQTGKDTFTRHEIELDVPTSIGWFVTRGIQPNERIATHGAQLLLSEEQKNQIQMED